MLTVTSHLSHAIGVILTPKSSDKNGTTPSSAEEEVFSPILLPETAVPARRTARYTVKPSGGDVLVRVCEGTREIKIEKPAPKPKTNGEKAASGSESDADSDSDEDEEETRTKVWKATNTLAELTLKDVKGWAQASQSSGGKNNKTKTKAPPHTQVEVMVNVSAELGVEVTAREVGGKGGVRGRVDAVGGGDGGGGTQQNGSV